MGEQHFKGRCDGAARQLGHETNGKREAAGVFPSRSVNQAYFGAVSDDANGDACAP
jgi:hypothetical protein